MEIYLIDCEYLNSLEIDLLEKYNKKEIKDLYKKKVHCFAYFALEKILQNEYSIYEPKIIFKKNKPYLLNSEKYFSITHSGKYIGIAISDYDCGVDVEIIKKRNFQKIAKRLGFICNSLEDFYQNWTHYESKYKLGVLEASCKTYYLNQLVITASSENVEEHFELVVQNVSDFSNLLI